MATGSYNWFSNGKGLEFFRMNKTKSKYIVLREEVTEGASNGSLNTNNFILINNHGILHLNRVLLIRFTDIDGIVGKELPFDLDIGYETVVWEIHRDPRLNDEREVYKARVDLKRMYYRRIR